MKEVFENIIKFIHSEIERTESWAEHDTLINVEFFVEDLADKYNNGWIPCSERLPSEEEYKKCNGQFIVSDGNRTYATYFDIYDTFKFGEPTIDHFKIDKCVIAWQPLPAPPKKEV